MALKNNEIIPVFPARSGQDGLDNDQFSELVQETAKSIDTSDANTVSVGIYGDYPTLDAALTYIQSQTCFNDITPAAADLPAVVQSFTQMESKILIYDGSGGDFWSPGIASPANTEMYWFQLTGDSFWYPLQGYQYVNAASEQYLISKVRRPEATNSSAIADIAISYKKAVKWTILLLDEVTDGGKTNLSDFIALTKPLVVDIIGVIKSYILNGSITFDQASAHYGRIHFKNCQYGRVRAANWGGANAEVSFFEAVHTDCFYPIYSGDFWGPPGMIYGSVEFYNCSFDHRQRVSVQQHIVNVSCYGDFINDGSILIDTPMLNALGGDKVDFAFCDAVCARNLTYTNSRILLNYNLDDLVDYFSVVERPGGKDTTPSAPLNQLYGAVTNVNVNNVTVTVNGQCAKGTLIPKISIISMNSSATGAAEAICNVSNCSIEGNGCKTYVLDNDVNNPVTVKVSLSNGEVNTNTTGTLLLEDHQEITATANGAIRSDVADVELNNTVQITATITKASDHRKPLKIKTIVTPATTHTVVLTAGTWDGTNQTATFSAINEFLEVTFDSAGNGIILNNIGVILSP